MSLDALEEHSGHAAAALAEPRSEREARASQAPDAGLDKRFARDAGRFEFEVSAADAFRVSRAG